MMNQYMIHQFMPGSGGKLAQALYLLLKPERVAFQDSLSVICITAAGSISPTSQAFSSSSDPSCPADHPAYPRRNLKA